MVNDERQRRLNIAGAKAVIEAIDAVVAQSKKQPKPRPSEQTAPAQTKTRAA